jgi:hypothetical protein
MGMVLLSPTSIAHAGTSASIGANGQVTFTAVTSLSLNGVFSATYDNYMVSLRGTIASADNIYLRYRVAGSDNSTANSYVMQRLYAESTTITAARQTTTFIRLETRYTDVAQNGSVVNIYGPFLAQPTALRAVNAAAGSGATIYDVAATHDQSTSYDGFTLYADVTFGGVLQVYGVRG